MSACVQFDDADVKRKGRRSGNQNPHGQGQMRAALLESVSLSKGTVSATPWVTNTVDFPPLSSAKVVAALLAP